MRNLSKRWQLEASNSERHALTKLARSGNRHEADRARAILAVLDGMTSTLIAEILRVTPEQVWRWRGQFIRGGAAALHSRPHPGRPARKAAQALPCIQHVLAQPAPPGVVWTVARLRDEVRRRTGVSISTGWLGAVMRKKGGAAMAAAETYAKGAAGPGSGAAGRPPVASIEAASRPGTGGAAV